MVLCAVPVEQTQDDQGVALIGQSSTAVHVDQRQAWVKVGQWDWESLFANTQLEPKSASIAGSGAKSELFRLSVIDASTGDKIVQVPSAEVDTGLTFRLCIEVEAPIALLPQPLRYEAYTEKFSGATVTSTDWGRTFSPVQYELTRLQNEI